MMKNISTKYILIGASALLLSITGCKKFTDEYNPANRTAETYYNKFAGFEDLAKSNYATLRGVINFPTFFNLGTDTYSTANINDNSGENLYNINLNSQNGNSAFYAQMYTAINIANNTIYWATQVTDGSAATVNTRVAEAKALRAFYYYYLAETFGDVPIVLTRTTGVTLAYTRAPEKDVYDQVIKDLNEAIAVLPATTTDFGRVTKGFAQHLLAKVYLTRGYKTYGGGNADFTQAAALAETVIASGTYALKPKFSDLFDPTVPNYQSNNEVIFSVQYSTNALFNGGGNTLQQWFLWDVQNSALLGRSVFYGKTNNAIAPDPYFFSLFNKNSDSRYLATVYDAVLTQVAGSFNGKSFAVGDTLIYYPTVPFTAAQKALRKYIVINPDEYRTSPFLNGVRNYPQFKKFRDPFVSGYVDNGGARDTYVFRLAETYLLAAEAYVKLNNQGKALAYMNVLRTRAAKTGTNPLTGVLYATEMQYTGSVTLDAILEERAKELVGEEFRWYELKRMYETVGSVATNKLLTRSLLYNDELKAAQAGKTILDAKYLLRPIPQTQIDLNRGSFPQNPGY
ncbi:RagB/SusD family nutrient uptake outer membrane protein [Pedobacter jejuensis]|uniref:RagB/SusD family nutrient uptake outer membrane protein n=1 Tax=Pedobacter jejuensis TaxID=1268550 RepID=A0A3N0C360_9SPHI|nr:RagB/SusD family nutrient uptake outer membrane protein [Pedobacter jejuensis]RNL56625.1 RagB/SusD family nutrient uptake outer membrane protein [Pedobacter jejuensis]